MRLRDEPGATVANPAEGTVSREIFSSETIFAQELERVFAPSWAFVGHTSQFAADGDYALSRVGQESVIVVRERGGAINVLLNSCRHRGMPVCRYDSGNASAFTCSYHAWSFDLGGALTGVPRLNEAYHGELDRSQWGLIKARVAVFHGSIWASFDESAPDFETFLGDMAYYVRDLMQSPDGEDDGYEVIGGIVKWRMPANWKFGAENFTGDHYHNYSHRSVDRLKISLSGKASRHPLAGIETPFKFLNIAHPGGHTVRANLYEALTDYTSLWGDEPEVDAYFRLAHEKRQKRLGDRARLITRGGGGVSEHALQHRRTQHDRHLGSRQRGGNGSMALALRSARSAANRQGYAAPLLFALRRTGRDDRAGRHGELERRTAWHERRHRAQVPVQLPTQHQRSPSRLARGLARRRYDGDGRRVRTQPARVLLALERDDERMSLAPNAAESGLAQLLLQREIEAFYTREAELLDERRFAAWLELFAEDARYFMPIARNMPFDHPQDEYTRERSDANWFDEGKEYLIKRVEQLESGDHWAEEPRSRTSHLITNVNIAEINGDELAVHCRFLVSQNRQETDVNLFVGKRIDKLRRNGSLQIVHRTIHLDQSVMLAKGLTTFF